MNILYSLGVIDKVTYDNLSTMDKVDRNIQIGYMQRDDKTIKNKLRDGFIEYRRLFFEANDIEDTDIVSIKKDAIFLLRAVNNIKFDSVEYTVKNIYTSFFKTNFLELYYDSTHNIIDIKGINSSKLKDIGMYNYFKKHDEFMLKKLKYFFKLKELNPMRASKEFMQFAVDYKNRELDIEFYRKLSTDPVFVTDIETMNGTISLINYDPEFNINISYNYNYIIKPIGDIMLK